MKRIIYALVLTSLCMVGNAQQTSIVDHYLVNPYLINPAMAGINGNNAFLDYNKQWQGFQGSPETQILTLDGAIKRDKFGLGLTIMNDRSNIIGATSGMLTYAYKADLTKTQRVRFGVSGGFVQNKIIYDNIIAEDESETQIFMNNQNATGLDVNAGFHYALGDFSIGFAANHVLPSKFQYENNFSANSLTFSNVRHFLIHTQYSFKSKSGKWVFQPSILMKGVQGIPFLLEGAATAEYKKQLWVTTRYKHNVGYTIAAGGVISKKLVIAYSYGMSSNRLVTQNSGSHEILLGFKFLSKKDGNGDVSSKDVTKLQEQNAELFEKVDYLSKENEEIREELERQKKLLKEKIYGLEELNAAFEKEKEERTEVVEENTFDLENNLDANNEVITTIDEGELYVIIAATRKIEKAKKFQKIVKREYKLDTKMVRNNNDTWYFVYSLQTKDIDAAKKELAHVKKLDTKNIYVGKPWVYKH